MLEDAAGLAAKGQSSSISREQMIELPSPSQATAAGCDNCCRSGENRDIPRCSLRWAGIGSRLPGARILGPILGDFPAGLDAEKVLCPESSAKAVLACWSFLRGGRGAYEERKRLPRPQAASSTARSSSFLCSARCAMLR